MSEHSETGPDRDDWRGMTPQNRGFTTPMVDDVFAVLSDWRRRAICRYLSEHGTGDVETLVRVVADQGQASSIDEGTSKVAVERALVHTHLPMLHDLGVLDYDERSGAVKYWVIPTIEKWIEHVDSVTNRSEF